MTSRSDEAPAVKAAINALFGDQPPHDPRYLLQYALMFGLTTKAAWLRAHRQKPNLIPAYRWVEATFRDHQILLRLARATSLKETMAAYLKLWRTQASPPTLRQCKDAGVDMRLAVRFFGGKRDLDRFVGELVRISRQSRRTSSKQTQAGSAGPPASDGPCVPSQTGEAGRASGKS